MLCMQKSSLQQCLHITSTIGNYHNVYIIGHDAIDNAIRFKKNLAVFPQAYLQEFFWIKTSFMGILHCLRPPLM